MVVRFLAWTIFATRLTLFDGLEVLRMRSINDYSSFHAAAYAISDGLDPYNPIALQAAAAEAGLPRVHPYFYPPFLAELLVPLTWLEPFAARLVWGFLSIIAFFGAMLMLDRWLARAVQPARASDARALFALAICGFWPIRATQWGGQVNGFVLLLLVIWWTFRERTPRAAIALGAAAAIKMSPALLILVPLSQRRFREAATASVTAALLVVGSCSILGSAGLRFLSAVFLDFLPGHRWHGLHVNVDVAGNHSLAALAYWLIDRNTSSDHLRLSGQAAVLHIAMFAALLAIWAVRARKVRPEASVAALTVLMVIAPTFAFEHHVAFAALSIAMMAALIYSDRLKPVWIGATVAATALLLEHEAAFAFPDRISHTLASLAHLPKLVPMLVIYAAALASSADPHKARDASAEPRGDRAGTAESDEQEPASV